MRDDERMIIAGLIFAAAAAAFHVFIFALESVKWTEPATRKIFGVASEEDAITQKALAFNQGFYNLFLAITAFVGVGVYALVDRTVGLTLVFAGTGMMLAAALVLILSDRTKARAATMQGTLPLLAVVLTAMGVGIG